MIEVEFRRGGSRPHYIEERYDHGRDRWIVTRMRPAVTADEPWGPTDHETRQELYGEPDRPGDPPVYLGSVVTKRERLRGRIVSGDGGVIDAYIAAHGAS